MLKNTSRIKPLYPGDVVRLRADELAAARWNGLRSTQFHVEKHTASGWVEWSNPIYQSDLLGIVYVVDKESGTDDGTKDEDVLAKIQSMICLPKDMGLKESKFDGPWDLPELDTDECRKAPVLFVREIED